MQSPQPLQLFSSILIIFLITRNFPTLLDSLNILYYNKNNKSVVYTTKEGFFEKILKR